MVARRGLLLAIALCAFLVIWWPLAGLPGASAACKEANQLTPYRGPFTSLCLRLLLSREFRQFGRVDLGAKVRP